MLKISENQKNVSSLEYKESVKQKRKAGVKQETNTVNAINARKQIAQSLKNRIQGNYYF